MALDASNGPSAAVSVEEKMAQMIVSLVRIETKLDLSVGRVDDHEARLRALEKRNSGEDHEDRIRNLEKFRYAWPSAAVVISILSLAVTVVLALV
jgi:hypothetical protein